MSLQAQSIRICERCEFADSLEEDDSFYSRDEVRVFYSQDSVIKDSILFLFVDLKRGTRFEEFDTRSMRVHPDSSFVMQSFNFDRSGSYRFSVVNRAKKVLASKPVFVKPLYEVPADYYHGTRLVFCSEIIDSLPVDTLQAIRAGKDTVRLLIWHLYPLASFRLTLDFWHQTASDSAFTYQRSAEFTIYPDWRYTNVPMVIDEKGNYKIHVYNAEEIWIGTALLEVKDD